MAAEIFGAGVNRQIDAEVERAEIERRRPGIVHQHQRALGMRGFGDGGDVLHLEAERARRFGEHHARVRLHQCGNAAADQWIVIGGRHAEPGQDLVAESARRSIGAVGDEHMLARAHHRKNRGRNRREPGRKERHARALRPLELLHRLFERFGGRGAAPPILVARAMGEKILGARIEHGRGVIDRRIDEAVVGVRVPTRGHQACGRAPLLAGFLRRLFSLMAGLFAAIFSAFILGHCPA